MSWFTIILYISFFIVWYRCVAREGGIGIGVRFNYMFGVVQQFLVGPVLYEVSGLADTEPYYAGREDAVELVLYSNFVFLFCAYFLPPLFLKQHPLRMDRDWRAFAARGRLDLQWRLGQTLILLGLPLLMLGRAVHAIPTMAAILTQTSQMVDAGLSIMVLSITLGNHWERVPAVLGWFVFSMVVRVIGQGFLGSSTLTLLVLLALVLLGRRCTIQRWLLLGFMCYLLLVPYAVWLSVRTPLREAIYKNRSIQERIGSFDAHAARQTAHLLNPLDPEDIKLIEHRIDQSTLMAKAMKYTPAIEPYAWGDTIFEPVAIALVPRFLWPNKPLRVGGSEFVSRYTGIEVHGTTSVGLNYAFEFYVNFGPLGTVICTGILGLACGLLDYYYFRRGLRSFRVEWTVLLWMWSICLSSHRVFMIAMTLPVGYFVAWMVSEFLRRTRWVPVEYNPIPANPREGVLSKPPPPAPPGRSRVPRPLPG